MKPMEISTDGIPEWEDGGQVKNICDSYYAGTSIGRWTAKRALEADMETLLRRADALEKHRR